MCAVCCGKKGALCSEVPIKFLCVGLLLLLFVCVSCVCFGWVPCCVKKRVFTKPNTLVCFVVSCRCCVRLVLFALYVCGVRVCCCLAYVFVLVCVVCLLLPVGLIVLFCCVVSLLCLCCDVMFVVLCVFYLWCCVLFACVGLFVFFVTVCVGVLLWQKSPVL